MEKILLSDLSASTLNLIEQTYDSLKNSYAEYQYKKLEAEWANQYLAIKADSWPECNSYNDFETLPIEIKDECINLHQFSPKIYYHAMLEEANTRFKFQDIPQFDFLVEFLNSHLEVLTDKKVIDFACNFGQWSFFCCNKDSKNVIGSDVRDENINIAKAIKSDYNIDNSRLTFLKEDLHNYSKVSELCYDRDTVLLFGVMYHVHDHVNILKAVCQPNVSYVVIESAQHSEIMDISEPLIWWQDEYTKDLYAGFDSGKETVLVGYPNVAWFDLAMANLNFKRTDYQVASVFSNCNQNEKYKQFRSMYLYERISHPEL